MPIRYAPTANFISTTLNGSVDNAVTTITLNSTANLQAPGAVVINRVNAAGTSTPSSREVVEYTGISGSDLTGCTRGADNSTARSHADGAIVETNVTVGVFNSLISAVTLVADSNGYLRPLASPASLAIQNIGTFLSVSGASIVGWPITTPVFPVTGSFTAATVNLLPPLVMPRAGTFYSFTFTTKGVASGVSAIVDVNKNGVSIFNAVGRPMIAAGGTHVSTASIATKTFIAGDVFTVDYDGTGGAINDFTILGVAR